MINQIIALPANQQAFAKKYITSVAPRSNRYHLTTIKGAAYLVHIERCCGLVSTCRVRLPKMTLATE